VQPPPNRLNSAEHTNCGCYPHTVARTTFGTCPIPVAAVRHNARTARRIAHVTVNLEPASQVSTTPNQPPPGISRTSIYVAAGRAIGAREPDPSVRNPDHLAERLLGDPAVLGVNHPAVHALSLSYDEAMTNVEVVNIVRLMMIRTRFIDEALERAIRRGATQVVILGAGFDTHAYRCQALLAEARVFEVDRAATQALKQQRVAAAIGTFPVNLTYVPIDFQRQDLASVLTRHGYDAAQPTFFILEGVTMYLPEEAVRQTLGFVAAHPPGSGIVFDFVYREMIDVLTRIDIAAVPEAARPFVQRFLSLSRDEPWVFGIDMGNEREYLARLGLELRELMTAGGEESLARYLTKADGTQVGGQTIVEGGARMAARLASGGEPADVEQARAQQRLMSYQLADAIVRS